MIGIVLVQVQFFAGGFHIIGKFGNYLWVYPFVEVGKIAEYIAVERFQAVNVLLGHAIIHNAAYRLFACKQGCLQAQPPPKHHQPMVAICALGATAP